MTDDRVIASKRLDLIPLTPAFFQASAQREHARAESLLGLTIPSEWYDEQWVMQVMQQRLLDDPSLQPWLMRAISLREQQVMIGHVGFHSAPGPLYLNELAPGAVEFGYTVFAAFRRRGYAREACEALMDWAHSAHRVDRFIVSIRPDNVASRALAAQFGFEQIGSHVDEIDGVEDIYELRR
jgi:[ribosomal protein S5]-alanine N-acetyltransferase